jgi:hypothetical protein
LSASPGLLILDLDIRVINAVTGYILGELTLNADCDYQPLNTRKAHRRPRDQRPGSKRDRR